MVLENFTYYLDGKKKSIKIKPMKTILQKFSGLMFKSNSPALLFIFNKEKTLSIHSFFCRPFKAIWLDKNKKTTKSIIIKNWKPNFSGRGKYLLEIPLPTITPKQ